MAKITIKSENITSFEGIFHVMDTFPKQGLGKLIKSTSGKCRNTGNTFQYSDILLSVFYSNSWTYYTTKDYYSDIFISWSNNTNSRTSGERISTTSRKNFKDNYVKNICRYGQCIIVFYRAL